MRRDGASMSERVFLSIGSNIGPRVANCTRAIELLAVQRRIFLVRKSPFYETSAWGKEDQPPFINCVVEVETNLEPLRLLDNLKKIESNMGRGPSERWGPRVIDLDIIFYGDRIVETRGLTIPHPHAHERGFVLIPLCCIAPDLVHPKLKKTVRELAGILKDTGVLRKVV